MSIILTRSLILSVMLQLSDASQICTNFFPNNNKKNQWSKGTTQKLFKTYLDNLLRIWIVQMCTFYFCDTFVSTVVFRKPEKKKIKYFQLSEIQNIASQNECLWNGRNVKKGKKKTQLSKKNGSELKRIKTLISVILSTNNVYVKD